MPVPRQKCSGTNYCHAVLCHCHKCEHNLTVSGNVGSAQIAWKNFAFFWWLQCHIIWFEWGWEMTKAGNLASWRFYGGDVCSSIAFTLLHRLLFKLFYTCHHFVTFVGRMSLKTLMEKDRSLLQKEEEPLMRYNYIFQSGCYQQLNDGVLIRLGLEYGLRFNATNSLNKHNNNRLPGLSGNCACL